nr:outer-membrane channel-forming protein I=LamB and maltoporin homolog {N-terminal} [Aeromonas hydrophila, Ah65, Peptide Partial, 16 aa] [Aeromonas hydrophila]
VDFHGTMRSGVGGVSD